MGGIFSGRSEYADTPDDRECMKLDVNWFNRHDYLIPGVQGTSRWTCGDEDAGNISWYVTRESAEGHVPPEDNDTDGTLYVNLKFTVTNRQKGTSTDYDYRVPITYTDCNFGGERPWFRCPGSGCSERVGKLYCPPGKEMFLCRHCHDFGYTSSRASGCDDRTLRLRYNRIRKKLDAEPCHPNSREAGTPDRPKGMHEETYYDLIRELKEANDEWLEKAFLIPMREHFGDRPEVDV